MVDVCVVELALAEPVMASVRLPLETGVVG